MMAIARSWAATVHHGLKGTVLFHQGGYKGGSESLLENFTQGRFFGVPILQWLGMTADNKRAPELGAAPYPHMIKWISDMSRGVGISPPRQSRSEAPAAGVG